VHVSHSARALAALLSDYYFDNALVDSGTIQLFGSLASILDSAEFDEPKTSGLLGVVV
jgi:hypothetical protein